MEDNPKGVTQSRLHAADPVPHVDLVVATAPSHRSVPGGESEYCTLLWRYHLTTRLRPRPLLEQQKFATGIIAAPTAQKACELQRKSDVA